MFLVDLRGFVIVPLVVWVDLYCLFRSHTTWAFAAERNQGHYQHITGGQPPAPELTLFYFYKYEERRNPSTTAAKATSHQSRPLPAHYRRTTTGARIDNDTTTRPQPTRAAESSDLRDCPTTKGAVFYIVFTTILRYPTDRLLPSSPTTTYLHTARGILPSNTAFFFSTFIFYLPAQFCLAITFEV